MGFSASSHASSAALREPPYQVVTTWMLGLRLTDCTGNLPVGPCAIPISGTGCFCEGWVGRSETGDSDSPAGSLDDKLLLVVCVSCGWCSVSGVIALVCK